MSTSISTTLEGRNFNQETFDRCDGDGIKRLVRLCEQCGLDVPGTSVVFKVGDVPVNLNGRMSVTGETPSGLKIPLTPVQFLEAEVRGTEGRTPWRPTGDSSHPYKFGYDSPSVVGRKAEKPLPLLQVSFDQNAPNATIILLRDARQERYWEHTPTVRGEDILSRVPLNLVVVIHENEDGIWTPCRRGCNKAVQDDESDGMSESQRIIMDIFWPKAAPLF